MAKQIKRKMNDLGDRELELKQVVFRRTQDGPWEPGLLLNTGDGALLDFDGHPVNECWMWNDSHTFHATLYSRR